eukprot:364100-Chlamydomonas_euryale.AAC.8
MQVDDSKFKFSWYACILLVPKFMVMFVASLQVLAWLCPFGTCCFRSSPLSGRPAQLSKLSGLAQEHAMAATSMAAALRAAGCLLAEAATTGSAASDLPAAVRAAAESSASGSAAYTSMRRSITRLGAAIWQGPR